MSALAAITIGNFDGVHRGHLALIRAARTEVGPRGRVIVLAFDPHPLTVLRPDAAPARLTSFADREEYLREVGADVVHRLTPTPEFLALDAEEFLAWLREQFRPDIVVEGGDFRFGAGRRGAVRTLLELGPAFGFRTVIVESVMVELINQQMVKACSSIVRWLLAHGRVEDAGRVLGRPFELRGRVIRGDQRGRELGVPTANLNAGELMLPTDGVYAGRAIRPDNSTFPAAISIGTNPTFGDSPRTCEAHLLGYEGPIDEYGWTLRLQFTNWLRDQLRFNGIEPLSGQIQRDLRAASNLQSSST